MLHIARPRALAAGSAISACALLGASGAILAQDESPAAEMSPAAAEEAAAAGHPLHIHAGTCEQLGDVVFPFGTISEDLMVHGEPADGEVLGSVTDQGVELNVTTVEATIADLTAAEHALNVHESEEAMDVNIACADIGGTLIDDDTLVLRLEPTDDSGYHGFVLLQEEDDGQTTVFVMATQTEAGTMTEEPTGAEASPETSAEPIEPGMSPEASPDASAEPGTSPEASPDASAEPGTSPDASAEPGTSPEASAEPVEPGTSPAASVAPPEEAEESPSA